MNEIINRKKMQPTEWEKIFANNINYTVLISKIYKEYIQLNIKKKNTTIKKWAECPNRHFPKEDILMANKHMKMFSITNPHRNKIKTTMRHHLTTVRKAIIIKKTDNKYW